MRPSDDPASFWARIFRCVTQESAEEVIRAEPSVDAEAACVVWSAHRAAAEREESRLEARTRDLEGLQAFGRALAEAKSVSDLVDRAAASLQVLADVDAVAIAAAFPERSGVDIYVSRSLAAEDLAKLREAVALGFVPLDPKDGSFRRLPSFDRFQGPRAALSETDIMVVPVERRGESSCAWRLCHDPAWANGR